MTCFILPKKPRRVCARRRKENGNHFLRRRVRRRKYRSARKRAKGVPFVRCSEPQPLSNESPVKRVSFESLSKILFDKLLLFRFLLSAFGRGAAGGASAPAAACGRRTRCQRVIFLRGLAVALIDRRLARCVPPGSSLMRMRTR